MYFYAYENRNLKRMRRILRQDGNAGCYMLYGPTASGKTSFLRTVLKADSNAIFYEADIFVGLLYEAVREGIAEDMLKKIPDTNVLVIENVEEISGRYLTQENIKSVLRHWISNGNQGRRNRKVILTTNQKRAVEMFSDLCCRVIKIEEIRMNPARIRRYCNAYGLHFTKTEWRELYARDNMKIVDFELRVRKLLLQKQTGGWSNESCYNEP